jgi:hypothetical protein
LILEAAKALRYKKNIWPPFADFQIIEGQTNCLKKRSEKLFLFFKAVKKFLQTIFRAVILEFRHDILSNEKSHSGGHQRV